jgi:hypothetical protein
VNALGEIDVRLVAHREPGVAGKLNTFAGS